MLFVVFVRTALVEVVHVLLGGSLAEHHMGMLGEHLLPGSHTGRLELQLAVDRDVDMACFTAFFHVQAYEVADEAFVHDVTHSFGNVL